MKYPKFLKEKDLIGITALSCGIGNDLVETKISFNNLKKEFKLVISPDVYGKYYVSTDIKTRVDEFNEILEENIKLLFIFRGGNFTYETLPYLDYEKIVQKNIWVSGASDPTSLLYILTTKYDIATIYGFNGKNYDNKKLEKYQLDNLKILKGDLITQESFMDRKTISLNGNFISSGIIIGGCLDILRFIPGTTYDNTVNFIKKYRDKKIIWYFDIYAMGSVDVYLTLLQFKNMGWFKYTDTLIFGSILFPKIECEMDYLDGIKNIFSDKNIIYDANIGHVKPVFTIINGSYATVEYTNNKMILKEELLDENNG